MVILYTKWEHFFAWRSQPGKQCIQYSMNDSMDTTKQSLYNYMAVFLACNSYVEAFWLFGIPSTPFFFTDLLVDTAISMHHADNYVE